MTKAATHLGAHGLDEGCVVLNAVHVAVADDGAVDARQRGVREEQALLGVHARDEHLRQYTAPLVAS